MIISKVELSQDSANAVVSGLLSAVSACEDNIRKHTEKLASDPSYEQKILQKRFKLAACHELADMISRACASHANSVDQKVNLSIVAVSANTSMEINEFTGSRYNAASIMSTWESVAQI